MLDTSRHHKIFSAHAWGDRRVDVVGVGATGSHVVYNLAKLGVKNIHVWDADVVEPHNVANQLYELPHVGMNKVDALKETIERSTGAQITAHNEWVDGTQEFGDVVFLLTDSMSSRKTIWEQGLTQSSTRDL